MHSIIERTTPWLTLIPLIVAALYLAGIAQQQAFLLSLGLQEIEFPLSFDRAVLGGFIALLLTGLPSVSYFAVGLMTLGAVLVVTGSVLAIARNVVRRADFRRGKRNERNRALGRDENTAPKDHPFEELGARIVAGGVTLAGVLIAVAVMVLAATTAGERAANRFKERAASGMLPRTELYIRGSTPSIFGTLITCGDAQCA